MHILSDIQVLELAGVLAGPSVGMFLAELGAQVQKIEHPGTNGDVTRSWRMAGEPAGDSRSSYFSSVNWGKQSLPLNVCTEEGRARLQALIQEADIVLVSFKPGDAEKLGLTYEIMRELNNGIIYAGISGFGEHDYRTAYDALLQAEAGFMHLNRQPGQQPMKMPVALIDILAAHHLKELILIAYIQKLKTGKGACVETSLYEAAVCSLANQAGAWLYAGKEPEPMGSEHPHIYPYGGSFTAGDGRELVLAVGNDAQFRVLCAALGDAELAQHPHYARNPDRAVHRDALRPLLQQLFSEVEEAEALVALLHKARVPAGMVRTVSEAVSGYENEFAMHQAGGMKGIPQLSGRINGNRVSKTLTEPPAYNEES